MVRRLWQEMEPAPPARKEKKKIRRKKKKKAAQKVTLDCNAPYSAPANVKMQKEVKFDFCILARQAAAFSVKSVSLAVWRRIENVGLHAGLQKPCDGSSGNLAIFQAENNSLASFPPMPTKVVHEELDTTLPECRKDCLNVAFRIGLPTVDRKAQVLS